MAAVMRWLTNVLCLVNCRKRCTRKTSEANNETEKSESSLGGTEKHFSSHSSLVEDDRHLAHNDGNSGDFAFVQEAGVESDGESMPKHSNTEDKEKIEFEGVPDYLEVSACIKAGDAISVETGNISDAISSYNSPSEESSSVFKSSSSKNKSSVNHQYNQFEFESDNSPKDSERDNGSSNQTTFQSTDPTSAESELIDDGEFLKEKVSVRDSSTIADYSPISNNNAEDIFRYISDTVSSDETTTDSSMMVESSSTENTENESSDNCEYNQFKVGQSESDKSLKETDNGSSGQTTSQSWDPTSEESEPLDDGALHEEKTSENSQRDKSSTGYFNTVTNDNTGFIAQLAEELKIEYPKIYESVIDLGFTEADISSFEMKSNSEDEVLDVVELFLIDDEPDVPRNKLELSVTIEGTSDCRTVKPDILIIVGGQEFRAHQSVICAESDYFKQRFIGKENTQIVYQIDSKFVSPAAFRAILTFLYTDEMRASCQQMAAIHIAACFLGIDRAHKKCLQMWDISSGSLKKAVSLHTTACHLGLEIPKTRTLEIMALHFESLLFEGDFLELTEKQMKQLLDRHTLGARSEMQVFLAALKWTDAHFLEREEHFADLMRCVRFPAMSLEEAISCFHPPILLGMVRQPQVRQMLLNAVCYISSKAVGQESSFPDLQPRPRRLLLSGKPLELWDLSVFHPDWHRGLAAVVIQASFRGHRARKQLEESESRYASFRIRQDFNRRVRQREAATTQGRSPLPQAAPSNYASFLRCVCEKRRANPESLE